MLPGYLATPLLSDVNDTISVFITNVPADLPSFEFCGL
jgi:hypothetical protein